MKLILSSFKFIQTHWGNFALQKDWKRKSDPEIPKLVKSRVVWKVVHKVVYFLGEGRVATVQSLMEDMATESSKGNNSAYEAWKTVGLLESSIWHILLIVLHLYPYKFQSLHQTMPADIAARKSFVKWALIKMEYKPQWLFNVSRTDEAHFEKYRDVNAHNSCIWEA